MVKKKCPDGNEGQKPTEDVARLMQDESPT
jgi:hypothetical protein